MTLTELNLFQIHSSNWASQTIYIEDPACECWQWHLRAGVMQAGPVFTWLNT